MKKIIGIVVGLIFLVLMWGLPNGPFWCLMNGKAKELGLLYLAITFSISFCGTAALVGWGVCRLLEGKK